MKKVISYILTAMMVVTLLPCFSVQANALSGEIDEYYEISIWANDGWDSYYDVIDLDQASTAAGYTVVLPYGMMTELENPADNTVRIEIDTNHQKIAVDSSYEVEYSDDTDADPDIPLRYIKEMTTPAKSFSETVTVKTDHSEYTFKINFKEASASEVMTPEISAEFWDGERTEGSDDNPSLMYADVNAEEAATPAGTTVTVPYLYDDDYGISMSLSTYKNEKVENFQGTYHMTGKDELKVEFAITSPDGKTTENYRINFVRDKNGDIADLQTCNVYASEHDSGSVIKEYEFDVDMRAAKTAAGADVKVPAEFINNEDFEFYILADSVNYGTFHYKWEFGEEMEAPGYLYCWFAENGQTVYTYTFSITSLNGKVTNNFRINLIPDTAESYDRVSGNNRYTTAIDAAETLKDIKGIDEFENVIVASGAQFADALAASYLAYVKDAPILLVGTDATSENQVRDYIKDNLAANGKVYIVGGTSVVTKRFESYFSTKVKRLAGANRYETNIAILKDAGVDNEELLIATGMDFADSLSASATKRPILLVQGNDLTAAQKEYMKTIEPADVYILGGTGAVSKGMETSLKAYDKDVDRIAGANRFGTAVAISEEFFDGGADTVVLAYGLNFPDGLAGGPIAMAKGAPLLLVTNSNYAEAAAYVKTAGVEKTILMGGTSVLADKTGLAVIGK